MKKVLIFGVKVHPIGGVENVVMSYTRRLSKDIICDYVMFGADSPFEEEIKARGGKVFYLPNRVKHKAAYKKAFNRVLREGGYDAVWGNYSGLTNIDLLKLGKKHRVPVRIAHSHACALTWGNPIMRFLVPLFHYMNKGAIAEYATHFWACSKEAGEFMFPKRVQDKLEIVNNAIDIADFCPDAAKRKAKREELGVDDKFVVGHIARMSEEKNQFFMLDVFREFLKSKPEARLLFVGSGDIEGALKAKAEADGLGEKVLFQGFRTDVADYHRAADIFLFPSIVEGLGLSLIEAQACGVPCVASANVPRTADISGCVDFVGLDEPIELWCRALHNMGEKAICEPEEKVRKANFDINEEAAKMSSFFKGENL
ncbi:MAG: glycosyltransferase [Clostridia bacterium]|nr:glycosyltransferase [Clostridia bacterium]